MVRGSLCLRQRQLLRFFSSIFFFLAIMIKGPHIISAASIPLAVSYSLSATPFTSVSSTIPAEFHYGNGTQIQWNPLFSAEDIQMCSDSDFNCFSSPLSINSGSFMPFNQSVSQLFVNKMGFLAFAGFDDPPFSFSRLNTFAVPQPDPQLSSIGVPVILVFGDMTRNVWDLRNDSLWSAVLNSSVDPTAYVLLIQGSLQSLSQMKRPSSPPLPPTSMDFQIQLHSRTGEVFLHFIHLDHATIEDLYNPIQVGMISVDQQVSMWAQYKSFQNVSAVSQTLRWSPVSNDANCIASDCSSCLDAGACGWCTTTSTCFSTSSTITNQSQWCPEALSLTCSAAALYACDSCMRQGHQWCSGDANCNYNDWIVSVVPNINISSATLPYCSIDNWFSDNNWITQMDSNYAPFCVPLGTPCSPLTCNEAHNSNHMVCHEDTDYSALVLTCTCESLWTTGTSEQLCSVCPSIDYAYVDDNGDCVGCPTPTPALIGVLIIAAGVVTFLLVKLNGSKRFQRCLVPVQNSIVFFQVISLLSLIDFRWPLGVKHMASIVSVLGLNFLRLPSVTCFMSLDEEVIFVLIAPILVVVILLVFVLIAKLHLVLKKCCGQLRQETHSSQNSNMSVTFTRAYLSFLILSYNFNCNTLLRSVYRQIMGSDADGDVSVSQSMDYSMLYFIIFTIIIYIIGIPICLYLLISTPSKNSCVRCCCQCGCCGFNSTEQSLAIHPLVAKYRTDGISRYWEATVVPLWKVSLNAIIVMTSGKLQIWLLASLLIVLVLTYAFVKPYANGINNREQSILLSGSLLVLLSGLLFYEASPATTSAQKSLLVFSYIVVFATMVAMILVMAYVIFQAFRQKDDEEMGSEVGAAESEREDGRENEHLAAASSAGPSYQSLHMDGDALPPDERNSDLASPSRCSISKETPMNHPLQDPLLIQSHEEE